MNKENGIDPVLWLTARVISTLIVFHILTATYPTAIQEIK